MIYIYQCLGFFLIPLIKINTLIRIKLGKELLHRYKERYGITKLSKDNSKKVIWIHAASIGEFKSADFLINKLHKEYLLIVTTTTLSAANYASKYYSNKIIHQFAPFDILIWVKKFLKHWQPSLVIWIESDLWPITLNIIKKQKINAILLNVRMSPKSFNRWKKIPKFYSQTIACFSEIFAQSENDQNRIIALSKKKIRFIGNLKLASINRNIQDKKFKYTDYKKNIINIMIVSTHKNEEEKILPIIKKNFDKYSNLQIIIAPRHPERAMEIKSLFKKNNILTKLEDEKNQNHKNIIIINSYGGLAKYFTKSDIVFLGGSLTPNGGHNPIEPALHKCVILTGSNFFNWQNIYEDMIKHKACIKIETTMDLEKELNHLLNNEKKIEMMKINAYNYATKQFVNTKLLEQTINKYIDTKIC